MPIPCHLGVRMWHYQSVKPTGFEPSAANLSKYQ